MNIETPRLRQVVDWRAAFWSGLISGIGFLLLNLLLIPPATGLSGGSVLRYIASLLLGSGVLPPPDSLSFGVFLAALVVNLLMSIILACIIAYVIHRGGMLTGIIGGAILGLVFYAINIYTLTSFFNWFYVLAGWSFAISHMIFGALAGGIYEGLEEEIFVPAE